MAETTIEWADFTFNPWEGCSKISPACKNCYAETRANRFVTVEWGPGKTRRRTSPANWRKPLRWNKNAEGAKERPRVFCASLADVFDEEVSDSWRDELFEVIIKCANLDFLLLTKRPKIMRDYLLNYSGFVAADFQPGGFLDHVWCGVTVEDQQRADERIPVLLEIPAAVRFLSVEPMLGPVDLNLKQSIDWVIAGGESGPGARPTHPEWFRSLRDDCYRDDVPFLFKQWGEWAPSVDGDRCLTPTGRNMPNLEPAGVNGLGTARLRRVGKKKAGRLLDGVTHDEFPKQSVRLTHGPPSPLHRTLCGQRGDGRKRTAPVSPVRDLRSGPPADLVQQ